MMLLILIIITAMNKLLPAQFISQYIVLPIGLRNSPPKAGGMHCNYQNHHIVNQQHHQ